MKKFKITGYVTCVIESIVEAEDIHQAEDNYEWDLDDIGDCIDLFIESVKEVEP